MSAFPAHTTFPAVRWSGCRNPPPPPTKAFPRDHCAKPALRPFLVTTAPSLRRTKPSPRLAKHRPVYILPWRKVSESDARSVAFHQGLSSSKINRRSQILLCEGLAKRWKLAIDWLVSLANGNLHMNYEVSTESHHLYKNYHKVLLV